jgi:hypothetical protein
LDIVPTSAGCIEFWARLADLPRALPWGQKPGLIGVNDKDGGNRGSILHFNGNDGASNGGLCAGLGGVGSAGTAQYGNWTYARALGTDTVGEWHHYALVGHARRPRRVRRPQDLELRQDRFQRPGLGMT